MMKILYICTHNRCRSILSEAVTNHSVGGKILARSAGSQPAGEVHPLSIKYLAEAGVPTQGLKSQSWDDFENFEPDVVITLCDSAAGESCPVWFGQATKIHWGLEDPSKSQGGDSDVADAFRQTIQIIRERNDALLTVANLDSQAWPEAMRKLLG